MRTTSRNLIAALTLFLGALISSADAAVILNDAAIEDFLGTDTLVLTLSIPPGEGLFAISITDQGAGDFEFSAFGIAEEYALFTATPGIEFTPFYVSANTPLVSNNGVDPGSGVVNIALNESRYFAYWDDRTFEGTPDAGDNFGWTRLTRTGSGLVVSESVTAIGGGILAGTTTQIPEPSRALLSAAALAVVGLRRWRRPRG